MTLYQRHSPESGDAALPAINTAALANRSVCRCQKAPDAVLPPGDVRMSSERSTGLIPDPPAWWRTSILRPPKIRWVPTRGPRPGRWSTRRC